MTDSDDLAAMRARLTSAGLGQSDLNWLAGANWRADSIPPVANQAEHDDYARREQALNRAVEHLSFAERGVSREGQLAAAIGARIADWRDRGEDDDD